MFYWVTFLDKKGRTALRGPYYSEMRAQEKVDSLDVEGEIHKLSTPNREKAVRILKEKKIDRAGVDEGLRNFKHKEKTK